MNHMIQALIFSLSLSSTMTLAAERPSRGPAQVVFKKDQRPVDGALTAFILTKDAEGTYTMKKHTSIYDRLNGREVQDTSELADGLTCRFNAFRVFCEKDNRPADGIYQGFSFKKEVDGTYMATYRTAYYDRMNGRSIEQSEVLAEGLTRSR